MRARAQGKMEMKVSQMQKNFLQKEVGKDIVVTFKKW